MDRGEDVKVVHGQCAMAKLYASEMAGRVADRAVQIYGARGYMSENVANRFFREARVNRIWEGTSEIQRIIIAQGLFKRGQEALAGSGGDRGVSRLRLAGASKMSGVGRFFLVAVCRADTAAHVEDDPRRTTAGRHRTGRTDVCSRRVTNRGDRR